MRSLEQLQELRNKHGFKVFLNSQKTGRAGKWSKEMLQKNTSDLPTQSDNWPKNAPLLDFLKERYAFLGFDWERGSREINGEPRLFVLFKNYPFVGGMSPTLFDLAIMPVELTDRYANSANARCLLERIGTPANFNEPRKIMDATGIGYMGMSGVSWLPALESFELPDYFKEELLRLADAIYLLYDAVSALYQSDAQLTTLLSHNVPSRIPLLTETGSVDILRPDIVIVQDADGRLRPVVTELESCPAGQGMTHAMQAGYGLPTEMVDRFMEYLDGRIYIVFATHEWSEYVWDQAAFCAAIRKKGGDAYIVFDTSVEQAHREALVKWKPPKDAPSLVAQSWNNNLMGRLAEFGFHFVSGVDSLSEEKISRAIIYRFGYFDNFSTAVLRYMRAWQDMGAIVINPVQFYLESKVLMAAIGIPEVRKYIQERDPHATEMLDRCVAETRLLAPGFVNLEELTKDKAFWLTKYAAWDGENRSWGSRSLEVGSQHANESWQKNLKKSMGLPWPVVAQHVISSARFTMPYVRSDDRIQLLTDARTRLTPFFLRGKNGKSVHCGSTITLRSNTFRIHGATDAVEAPVVYK